MKTRPFQELQQRKLSQADRRKVAAAVERDLLELDLRALREHRGATQAQLAGLAEMAQPEVSRLERRDDYRVSTLRRVVAALGGELEIIANFDGQRIRIR
jgi:hypothetical protein